MSEEKLPKRVVAQESGIAVVKGLIGAVPWIGAAMNEALFEMRARLHQQRVEAFTIELGRRIDELGKGAIKMETVRSEEFSDLLTEVLEKVVKNRSKKKVGVFAEILTSSMSASSLPDLDSRELYVNIVSGLNESELEILRHLHDYAMAAKKRLETSGDKLDMPEIDYSQATLFGVPKTDFVICFETLIAKGLVFDDSFGRWDSKARTFIKPTPLAVELVSFLKSCSEKG